MNEPMALVVEAVGAQLCELAAADVSGFHPATIDDFTDFARRAEAAGVDALFYADFMGKPREQFARRPLIPFEPITALAAIAAHTSRIGLVATASTTFSEPYTVARQIASLDNVSHGRAGWNAVTSIQGHGNYGRTDLGPKTDRYARATEFTDAVLRLWRGWSANYRDAGMDFVNTEAIDEVNFAGDHVRLSGWLDIPSDAQGRPVIFQAGSSDAGIDFASHFADVVFGITPTQAGARRLRSQLRDAAERHGRDPDSIRFLPGARVFVDADGHESADGQESAASSEPSSLIRATMGPLLGVPIGDLDVDAPLPAELVARRESVDTSTATISGTVNAFWDMAEEHGATLRSMYRQHHRSSGFLTLEGSGAHIAERMMRWVDEGAADGFVLGAGGPIDDFYDQVMPLLRACGAVRTRYETTTLREHLGLEGAGR